MKGYSLIELVMGIAISLIILMSLFSILKVTDKSLITTYENNNSNNNINYAMEYIKDEINLSQYYAKIGTKYYFIREVENKYKYVTFVKDGLQVKREVAALNNLSFNEISSSSRNILLDECRDFSIVVVDNVAKIKIEDNNKIYERSIAMRAKEYEKE